MRRWRQLEQRRWRRRTCLLCYMHKAWEAPRLRALNEVLGVQLQPKELLEAVEAPWREERDEVSSEEEAEVCGALQPGGLAPKRVRDGSSG